MSADRPVSLRLDVNQQPLADTSANNQQSTPREANPESRRAFQQALHGGSSSASHADNPGPAGTPAAHSDALPHGIPSVTLPAGGPASAPALDAGIQDALCNSLERLLVSEDGARDEVRLDISDETLPGVSVNVFEDEGRLVVCFTCSVDKVRRDLDAAIHHLAQQLANRLHRDVLLQVQTDDPQDLRLNEALASPQ